MDDFAEEFARLAVELHEQSGVDETVDVVLDYALRAVAAGWGSVMLLQGRTIEVAGVTDPVAARADELQLECDEGLCLDAAAEADSFLIANTLEDLRWPRFDQRAGLDESGRDRLAGYYARFYPATR